LAAEYRDPFAIFATASIKVCKAEPGTPVALLEREPQAPFGLAAVLAHHLSV
jgi:hypothetical protein